MKTDAFELALLFDFYGEMLTEKQQTCFDLYYNQDLSLGEIAEQAGISRQGVHDTLARTEAALRQFEDRLGCAARARRLQTAAAALLEIAAELQKTGREDLAQKLRLTAEQIKE